MSISTYQFAHNNPVWKIELEGLEGKEIQGKDLQHHEPIKVTSPNLGFVGGGLTQMKVYQETTKEVVKEVVKKEIKNNGGKLLSQIIKGAGTVFALLSDTMSPNFGGSTDEGQWRYKVDEKLSLKDFKIEEKGIEETGIKRFYEDNKKHGKEKKGNVGKSPDNAQDVLDNSYELPGNTTRRIGIDYENNVFNIYDEHSEGKFHGHVRSWTELSQDMQNILLKEKKVTKKGKIIE